jgi:two-component system cell cycle response regulator DivK
MAKTILIVEDDSKSLKLMRDLLNVLGYITFEANNGQQAVDVAKTEKLDLILMDIQMPGMDGLEATKVIKADITTRDIPIIALTANAMRGDEEKVLQAGCNGYVTKPVNIRILQEKMNGYLSESRL